jgi:hypothetical protein
MAEMAHMAEMADMAHLDGAPGVSDRAEVAEVAEVNNVAPVCHGGSGGRGRHGGHVAFAHPSEADFAALLDFYGVRWAYEPRTFVLRSHPDGRLAEGFTPDFYLPEYDVYVELTTMRQALVRHKNRKMRRLRELYPEITLRMLYARSLNSLRARHGFAL